MALKLQTSTNVDLISTLPTPFYIGHKGSYLLYPENSMEGCARSGFGAEMDVQGLADGHLAIMHDATGRGALTTPSATPRRPDRRRTT